MPVRIRPLPPIEELRHYFDYRPDTGELFWRNPPAGQGQRRKPGDSAGCPGKKGYLLVVLNRQTIFVHRVCHALIHGFLSQEQIDHKDRNPQNNRADNLREATHAQNIHNRKGMKGIDIKGVYRCRVMGNYYYRAVIRAEGKTYELGVHKTPLDAAKAYNEAAVRLHGEFAMLNDLEAVPGIPRYLIPSRISPSKHLNESPAVQCRFVSPNA
jgi:hypothetical protein